MSRINLLQDMLSAISSITGSNPGALSVCISSIKAAEKIDPDNAFKEIALLIMLDNEEIYGSKIWELYKDICKQNLIYMFGILRARQLGIIPSSRFEAILSGTEVLVIPDIMQSVREHLPNFIKEDTLQ